MDNQEFLQVISNSFKKFVTDNQNGKDASRNGGNDSKLSILHSAIANDILERINNQCDGNGTYSVKSLGLGGEGIIEGRYIDKKVDITILQNSKPIAGVAVKFVMQNYQQNSNNYFENMLGETANIRCYGIPYFQIFIIFEKMPYYIKKATKIYNPNDISKWENVDDGNMHKYLTLSNDKVDNYLHTPNKTLLYVIKLFEDQKFKYIKTKSDYMNYYSSFNNNNIVTESDVEYGDFSDAVVYNNYEEFIKKVIYRILSV